jgi:[protein-PII] uridylyltransferase
MSLSPITTPVMMASLVPHDLTLTPLFHHIDQSVSVLMQGRLKEGRTVDPLKFKSDLRAILNNALHAGREGIREELLQAQDGFACVTQLSHLMDKLIVTIFTCVTQALYPQSNASTSERLVIVATGGYGRGKMAPGSDVDLLFLLPYKQNAWTESVVEAMLYTLWDLKLKVGYATRTIQECLSEAREDMTIRTSLLETRFLVGDAELYHDLVHRFDHELVRLTAPEFIEAKLTEREHRVTKAGAYRYLVEPNVKDGKGGLRDLNTLFWITRYVTRAHTPADFIRAGVFTPREMALFERCESFLWRVRSHMHFIAGKAQERLSFDLQRPVAEAMGFKAKKGLSAVERFMKRYFLVTKDVGDLTAIVCAELEARHAKPKPVFERVWGRLRKRRLKTGHADFFIDASGRLTIIDDNAFVRDPVNLIRLFWLADKINAAIQPDATRLATRSLKLMSKEVRRDPIANHLFLEILQSQNAAETTLRRMNEAGVLGRFVPDFGKVVAMMQFNMYHHYTVDEHLLRSIGILAEIETGHLGDEHPLAHTIFSTIHNKRVLYVALFLHDIAKGRPEDHSTAGADVARKLGPRFGLTPAETDTVAWLIEHHLLMSMTAQARDLADMATIENFARVVQSLERLKLLLILTICDIKAVGPGVWNGWKGELLRTLYYETEIVLAGGHSAIDRQRRVEGAIDALWHTLKDWDDADFQTYAHTHDSAYWLKTDLKRAALHAQMSRQKLHSKKNIITHIQTDRFRSVTEIDVVATPHPDWLAVLTGACAAAGANIVDASVFTAQDGIIFTTLALSRGFEEDRDEKRRAEKITTLISKTMSETDREKLITTQIAERRQVPHKSESFSLVPDLTIDNTLSHHYTVLEVTGLDRTGLLYDITSSLGRLNMRIGSAHIATFGERAVDVFYVTHLDGTKVVERSHHEKIRKVLMEVLTEG